MIRFPTEYPLPVGSFLYKAGEFAIKRLALRESSAKR